MSSAKTEPATVYRTGQSRSGKPSPIHYSRDCRYLEHARSVLEKPLASFWDDHPRCSECWPEELRGGDES